MTEHSMWAHPSWLFLRAMDESVSVEILRIQSIHSSTFHSTLFQSWKMYLLVWVTIGLGGGVRFTKLDLNQDYVTWKWMKRVRI